MCMMTTTEWRINAYLHR